MLRQISELECDAWKFKIEKTQLIAYRNPRDVFAALSLRTQTLSALTTGSLTGSQNPPRLPASLKKVFF